MSSFFCGQVLVSTESATSGQWATFRYVSLSALSGRLGRVEFMLDDLGWKKVNQHTHYSYTTTAFWLSTLNWHLIFFFRLFCCHTASASYPLHCIDIIEKLKVLEKNLGGPKSMRWRGLDWCWLSIFSSILVRGLSNKEMKFQNERAVPVQIAFLLFSQTPQSKSV